MTQATPLQTVSTGQHGPAEVVLSALALFAAGDMAAFRRCWADRDVDIVDDVAPYIWKGDDSVERWLQDTGAHITGLKLSHVAIVPQTPRWVETEGERAFVVLPVVVDTVRDGVAYRQDGEQVVVLSHTGEGWKMQTMAYSGGAHLPVGKG